MNIRQTSITCQECQNDIKWKGAWTEMPTCKCGWRFSYNELLQREREHNIATTVLCSQCSVYIYRILSPIYLHEPMDFSIFVGIGDYSEPEDFECPSCGEDWRVKKDGYWYFRTADGALKPERGRDLSEFEFTSSDGER